MRLARSVVTAALSLAFLSACGGEDLEPGDDVGRHSEAIELAYSGMDRTIGSFKEIMGIGLNGVSLNGKLLDGLSVSQVLFRGATRNGRPLASLALEQTVFSGTTEEPGGAFNRLRSEGLELDALLQDGTFLRLQVDSVQRSRFSNSSNIYEYVVSYATQAGRASLCGLHDDGTPVPAVPLNGRWDLREGEEGGGSFIDDPQGFTFACQGYVAAKCVEMGYFPWRLALQCTPGSTCQPKPIGFLHQSCTRMLRADYCGDGMSHTHDNVRINAFDRFQIRVDSADWLPEAEWGPEGASCTRYPRAVDLPTPPCFASRFRSDCAEAGRFLAGAELISEVQ